MVNKTNTKLPKVSIPQPPKTDWFSGHYIWGYAFLVLAFLLAIAFIYQMEFGRKPKESRICIQVVTSAVNKETGEVKDFPTPCDVPEGWEVRANQPTTNPDGSGSQNDTQLCIQVVVSARHKVTGEIREFPTPCHVTDEWEEL